MFMKNNKYYYKKKNNLQDKFFIAHYMSFGYQSPSIMPYPRKCNPRNRKRDKIKIIISCV